MQVTRRIRLIVVFLYFVRNDLPTPRPQVPADPRYGVNAVAKGTVKGVVDGVKRLPHDTSVLAKALVFCIPGFKTADCPSVKEQIAAGLNVGTTVSILGKFGMGAASLRTTASEAGEGAAASAAEANPGELAGPLRALLVKKAGLLGYRREDHRRREPPVRMGTSSSRSGLRREVHC